jgi:predicted  nucleic acid-binding Zn-ribbon protein
MLEALHRLQDVERKLAELRREREVKTRRVEYHQRQAKKAEEKLHENQLTIRDRQKKLDGLQLDMAVREESIGKHRQALNKAKTNREYAAILTAMNTEKADNTRAEGGILQLMEEVQNLKNETAAVRSAREKLLEEFARAEEVLRAYDEQSRLLLEDLQANRDACAERLPPATLVTFTRVAEHLDGEAMARIVKLRPKRDEYACSGCHMNVALEVVNALQTRDDLQLCKVCGRILYLEMPESQPSRN